MSLSNNYLVDNFINASNWTVISGTWTVLNGEYRTNGLGESITKANDFLANNLVFDCELMLSATGDAGVTVRSSDGVNGYFISFRPLDNEIRVYDLTKPAVIATTSVSLAQNSWRRIRVIMINDCLLVYYGNMSVPIVNVKTNIYIFTKGSLFLRSYNNQAAYKAVRLYEAREFWTKTLDGQPMSCS